MNLVAFLLMIIFLGLGAAFYVFGVLVIDHISLSVQLDQKIQQTYNWVLQYGSPEQQKAAQISVQKRDLDQLQTLAGLEVR